MSLANDVRESLRRAGLTTYESEAYVVLLSKREVTADEVARMTSIPITRVYGTLEQLMQKGFARIIQSRPKRFHAIPPAEAKRDYLAQLRTGFEQDLLSVEEILRALQRQVEPIYVQSHLQVNAEELLEPLENLQSMEKRTGEYILNASDEVLISTALFSWLPRIRSPLLKAIRNHVKVRILMQIENTQVEKDLKELARYGAQIRDTREPWHPVRGSLVDGKDLTFVIWAAEEADRHWYPIVYTPNHTKNPGLIRIFQESFEFRWNNAKRVNGLTKL